MRQQLDLVGSIRNAVNGTSWGQEINWHLKIDDIFCNSNYVVTFNNKKYAVESVNFIDF